MTIDQNSLLEALVQCPTVKKELGQQVYIFARNDLENAQKRGEKIADKTDYLIARENHYRSIWGLAVSQPDEL
ncbi:hypothetical protein HZA97_01940 [Candidatus Woesearchaeota archaeon]|nr:hypothetical protein [Candidatus Woesearchaeota archaeon]